MNSANLPVAKRNFDKFEDTAEFCSFSESNKENGGKYVDKDAQGRRKHPRTDTPGKTYKNLDYLNFFCDSRDDKRKGLEKFVEENSKYKFRFGEKDKKPVEKSESEEMLDICWAEMDKCLYGEDSEDTDLIQPEVDNGDHSTKTQIDCATLCSQGNHPEVFLNEQVGTICKYCSVVVKEIHYILPSFSKKPFLRKP